MCYWTVRITVPELVTVDVAVVGGPGVEWVPLPPQPVARNATASPIARTAEKTIPRALSFFLKKARGRSKKGTRKPAAAVPVGTVSWKTTTT